MEVVALGRAKTITTLLLTTPEHGRSSSNKVQIDHRMIVSEVREKLWDLSTYHDILKEAQFTYRYPLTCILGAKLGL